MDTMTRPNLSAETIEELQQLNHAADPPTANLAAPLTDPRWSDDALCAQTDPDAFFPEKGGATRDAKRVCTSCDVKAQCLAYALATDQRFGVWGGLSERERRRLKEAAKG